MSETELPVMPGQVTLVNRATKDIKNVKIGFDWPAFFSPFIFGLPHLLRKVWVIGGILLVVNVLSFFVSPAGASQEDMMVIAVFALLVDVGIGIWLGKNGRSQFAKSLLSQGYELAHPEEDQTKAAKLKWGIL